MYNITMRLIYRNEVICFTGKSKYTRGEMEKIALNNGALITRNITPKTTLLVMGLKPGSKLDRAYFLGIKMMLDDEFFKLLNI